VRWCTYIHIFLYSAMYVKCKMYVLNLCVHVYVQQHVNKLNVVRVLRLYRTCINLEIHVYLITDNLISKSQGLYF